MKPVREFVSQNRSQYAFGLGAISIPIESTGRLAELAQGELYPVGLFGDCGDACNSINMASCTALIGGEISLEHFMLRASWYALDNKDFPVNQNIKKQHIRDT